MPADLLTDIVRQIDARRRELADAVHEYQRLEAARAALVGTARPASSTRPSGSRTATKRTPRGKTAAVSAPPAGHVQGGRTTARARSRAPRGANRAAFLAAVQERPGASVAEIADATGIQRAVLYQLRRRLFDDGAIAERPRDDGRKGYALTAR
jgi:DNA-binding transcriptional ArsR family regulator